VVADLSLGYVNPAVVDILGYEPDELVGRSATEIIHPDDFGIALGALTQLVAEYGGRSARSSWAASMSRSPVWSCGVLYLDLDDFKPVNDTHGHGDELLRAVTERIEGTVRPDDLVARLGGDEFAMLCPSVRDASVATAIAQRLIHEVARPIELSGAAVQVGLSVGVAISDRGEGDGPQLLAAADAARYEAKRAGKGQWRLAP